MCSSGARSAHSPEMLGMLQAARELLQRDGVVAERVFGESRWAPGLVDGKRADAVASRVVRG